MPRGRLHEQLALVLVGVHVDVRVTVAGQARRVEGEVLDASAHDAIGAVDVGVDRHPPVAGLRVAGDDRGDRLQVVPALVDVGTGGGDGAQQPVELLVVVGELHRRWRRLGPWVGQPLLAVRVGCEPLGGVVRDVDTAGAVVALDGPGERGVGHRVEGEVEVLLDGLRVRVQPQDELHVGPPSR